MIMGQCVSVPHRKLSLMREGSTRRFYCSRNGNLSATFHVLDSDLRWDLMNVNNATEEQLMTLPGINRVTAENIVEYRQRIGGFKKVEDLALVSGVGATKLEQFRTEICVSRRKGNNGSYNSSLTQSLESLQITENGTRCSPSKLVNVNTANVFQLMSVCRMTQEMAAYILHYRERKGPFKTLDELSKVKGLPPDRLAVVKMYLTIDPCTVFNNSSSAHSSKLSQNSMYNNSKRPISHRRTNSAPGGLGKSRSYDPSTRDLYELVSSQVSRPPTSEVFNYSHSGKPALRLASWNLQQFLLDKAKNPGVQEVICRTILENGLSLVAVQEVTSRAALSLIASELNDPQLCSVQSWEGERGKWHSLVPPPPSASSDICPIKPLMNGFLYDTKNGLQLRDSTVLYLPPDKLAGLNVTCQPFLGWFRIEKLDFVVVTFSLISESCVAKLLPSILELLKERIPGEKNIFLMGDFILPPGHTVFEVVSSQGYNHLLPVGAITNHASQQEESHLWASLNVRKIFSGRSGVVAEGLTHLAIPNGWHWGGPVSDHCPVWAEVFTEENPTNDSKPTDIQPIANGVRKLPTISTDTDDSDSDIKKLSEKKSKSFWERSWMWRYGNKNSITVEKSSSPLVKENGCL